jgi:hypothetical protein
MNTTIWLKFVRKALGVLLLGLASAHHAQAQWIVPPTPANQLSVDVTPTVTFNPATGLYEYNYQVINSPSSAQKAVVFALRVQGNDFTGTAPTGWTFGGYEARPIVSWAATEAAPDPPGFVDDGSLPLAAHSIAANSAKSGFKLVSAHPPGTVTYYVKGEVPEAVLADGADADALPAFDPDIEVDSVRGTTVGPVPVVAPEFFEGGRRPATDAFLVFVNVVDGDVRTNPTSIIVKFGARGETVDRSSFRAELNGVDVTAAFAAASAPGDLVALFTVGSSPLKVGKNVLLTSVSGIIPGTNRSAGDVDRVVFTVQ